jgi:hypothetical protein
MKSWMPFTISFIVAVVMNVLPLAWAEFVDNSFYEVGFVLYFLTIPAGILLMLAGLIISLVLFFKRRSA